MIETKQQREDRERAESAWRQERIRQHEKKMGVELPYSPVSVLERKPPEKPAEVFESGLGETVYHAPGKRARRNRGAYMKAFRQRPVVCPKCGHEFNQLKRKSASKVIAGEYPVEADGDGAVAEEKQGEQAGVNSGPPLKS